MNEEIIIDGVDVKQCRWFIYCGMCGLRAEPKCRRNETYISYHDDCKNMPNCYFKQLKRLQEENEGLKKYQYKQEYLQSEIEKRQKALEEIRDMVSKLIAKKGYAKDEEDFVLAKTQGVLNDRD